MFLDFIFSATWLMNMGWGMVSWHLSMSMILDKNSIDNLYIYIYIQYIYIYNIYINILACV